MRGFIDRLTLARRIMQQRTSAIRTTRPNGKLGPKPKMANVLAMLEDLLGQGLPTKGAEID